MNKIGKTSGAIIVLAPSNSYWLIVFGKCLSLVKNSKQVYVHVDFMNFLIFSWLTLVDIF